MLTDEQVLARVVRGPGCWRLDRNTKYPESRATIRGDYAYRVVYEILVGPIPEGYVIDHECRNVWCVRPGPDHCVPVTMGENSRRGQHRNYVSQVTGMCAKGLHSMADAYSHHGRKRCRQCTLDYNARWKAKKMGSD